MDRAGDRCTVLQLQPVAIAAQHHDGRRQIPVLLMLCNGIAAAVDHGPQITDAAGGNKAPRRVPPIGKCTTQITPVQSRHGIRLRRRQQIVVDLRWTACHVSVCAGQRQHFQPLAPERP